MSADVCLNVGAEPVVRRFLRAALQKERICLRTPSNALPFGAGIQASGREPKSSRSTKLPEPRESNALQSCPAGRIVLKLGILRELALQRQSAERSRVLQQLGCGHISH